MLQLHTGEAGGGRRGGALVKVQDINTAGVPTVLMDTRYKVRGHLLCRGQHLEDRRESISKQEQFLVEAFPQSAFNHSASLTL